MQFIDLATQQQRIRPQIDAAIKRVLDHGRYIMGPEVSEFEQMLADFVGVRHAIGCSSGTDALLLALMAYEIGPGDAIFTTPFTFFASCETIALTGATPVFVDIDPKTFNIDVRNLEAALADFAGIHPGTGQPLRPRGIMPVDLFGLPADYDAILQLADAHDLFVIEDAAQSCGATYKDRRAPGLAHIGATSFFPAKPLGCYGDGGAVFTDDDELADRVRSLLVHGKGSDKYDNVRVGLNARLDTLQAAILIEKLKIFDDELTLRETLARTYSDALHRPEVGVSTPQVTRGCRSAWAQYTLTVDRRDELQTYLREAGIPSMVYYANPAHLLKAMSGLGYRKGDFPTAERASETVLSLPFSPYMEAAQVREVITAVDAWLALP